MWLRVLLAVACLAWEQLSWLALVPFHVSLLCVSFWPSSVHTACTKLRMLLSLLIEPFKHSSFWIDNVKAHLWTVQCLTEHRWQISSSASMSGLLSLRIWDQKKLIHRLHSLCATYFMQNTSVCCSQTWACWPQQLSVMSSYSYMSDLKGFLPVSWEKTSEAKWL